MKVQIGRLSFDTVTPDEHRSILRDELDDRDSRQPLTSPLREEQSGVTNAAGGLLLPVFVVKAGMEFRLHLLIVEADGFTFAAPFNGPGAFWRLRVASRTVDGASLVAGAANGSQLPLSKTYGFMQGAESFNNEPLEYELTAGPANTQIRVYVQGALIPRPGTPAER